MSDWITDREPHYRDDGYYVFNSYGKVTHWAQIQRGEAWMPIVSPERYVKPHEPYVKPKLQRYIVVQGKLDDRFLELEECEAEFDSAVCMSDDVKHIEAINAKLLEALEALQPYVLHLPDGAPIKETIRAAIAKAKGEQP